MCVCVFFLPRSLPSVTEEALDCSWKRKTRRKAGLPGSCRLLLLLALFLSAFDLLVDSIAQKGPDLGHEGTSHCIWGECALQVPGHLSCSDLGRAQNSGPTESMLLWSTRESEPEWHRSEKCTQPKVHLRQFPSRATRTLNSVNQESTHTVSRSKPSVGKTLQALPTHASDICLQCSTLPTPQLNK